MRTAKAALAFGLLLSAFCAGVIASQYGLTVQAENAWEAQTGWVTDHLVKVEPPAAPVAGPRHVKEVLRAPGAAIEQEAALPHVPSAGLRIERFDFTVDPGGRGRYRYAVVNSRENGDFRGEVQFVVAGSVGGEPVRVVLAERPGGKRHTIRQRLNSAGYLALPVGLVVGTIEMQLVDSGAVRASSQAVSVHRAKH